MANNALNFGGAGYVALSNNPNTATNNFSVLAWIKPVLPQQTGAIFYNGNDSSGYGLFAGDAFDGTNSKLVALFGNVTWADPGVTLTNGVWQHVGMVRRSGTLYFYLNGVETASVTNTPNTPAAGIATIGAQMNGTAQRFYKGIADEVKPYNIALSATDVIADYASGAGRYGLSTDTGISAIFHLDEGTGTTTADSSTTALTGTLSGTTIPTWTTGIVSASGTVTPTPSRTMMMGV